MLGEKYIVGLIFCLIFAGGVILGLSINNDQVDIINNDQVDMPSGLYENNIFTPKKNTEFPNVIKRNSPLDRVKEKDIKIYKRKVIIDVDNAILAGFTDTKSMEPVLNKDTNAIEIVPKDINDIQVGDIISYKSAFADGIIIHRVVEKDIDEKGLYFRTKGDNLDYTDPEKIRQNQIRRVVVGILY